MPSAKILEQKQKQVSELAEKFKKAKMIVLSEYRGINVEDDTNLRSSIRNAGNEYSVIKNSIIAHAAKQSGIEGLEEFLKGPTAIVIGYEDYIEPAKVLNDYSKDHDFYTIKAGVMDGKVISVSEVKKLATLPSKETLYSMLASALLGNIRNLAVVLDQTRQSKEVANA